MDSKLHIIFTEDGSPTAFFDDFKQEKMHHSGGAWGESVFIYGPALQWGFIHCEKPNILSLGTGLAYNEILASAYSIIFEKEFSMLSFEKNDYLNESLKKWLNENFSELNSIYDLILDTTARNFDLDRNQIKKKLIEKNHSKDWSIQGAIEHSQLGSNKYNVILYDFFSSKAMEEFWGEDFLTHFLEKYSDSICCFSTYACKGTLKRALKKTNFSYFERKGFLWKRSSTFAMRK